MTSNETGAGPQSPAGSDGYVCVDPSQRSMVFDYFKGFHQDQKVDVMTHLGLCLQCREALSTMLRLNQCAYPAQAK